MCPWWARENTVWIIFNIFEFVVVFLFSDINIYIYIYIYILMHFVFILSTNNTFFLIIIILISKVLPHGLKKKKIGGFCLRFFSFNEPSCLVSSPGPAGTACLLGFYFWSLGLLATFCLFLFPPTFVFFYCPKHVSHLVSRSKFLWVPVNSTGKVSDSWIKVLEFIPCLYQKLIGVLVW